MVFSTSGVKKLKRFKISQRGRQHWPDNKGLRFVRFCVFGVMVMQLTFNLHNQKRAKKM